MPRNRDWMKEPKRIRSEGRGVGRFRGIVNPRWRALDAIRDAEVRGGVPFGDQRLPRQRDADGRTPLEPPYQSTRYWTTRRFRSFRRDR